jgi:hypothetical protein
LPVDPAVQVIMIVDIDEQGGKTGAKVKDPFVYPQKVIAYISNNLSHPAGVKYRQYKMRRCIAGIKAHGET